MMSKKNKIILIIFWSILIITIMALIYLNINNKKITEPLEISKENFQLSKEEKLISKVQTVSNTSNTEVSNYEYEENSSSEQFQNTSSYTPKNIDRSNNNSDYINSFNSADLENSSLKNVKVEVLEESVSANGVTVVITDNNDVCYTWDPDFYKIEQKINNTWQELSLNKPLESTLVGYTRDENNQFKFKINWIHYYGTLKNGTYRIVEIPIPFTGEKEYVYAYSNEFEIKK